MMEGIQEMTHLPFYLQKQLLAEIGDQASQELNVCNPFGGPASCVELDPSEKFKRTCPELVGRKVDCVFDLTATEGLYKAVISS